VQFRLRKTDVTAKPKTRDKCYWQLCKKRCYVRCKCKEKNMKILLFKHKIVKKPIQHPTKNSIYRTANAISEKLLRKKTLKRRVKKINNLADFCANFIIYRFVHFLKNFVQKYKKNKQRYCFF